MTSRHREREEKLDHKITIEQRIELIHKDMTMLREHQRMIEEEMHAMQQRLAALEGRLRPEVMLET